MTTIKPNDNDNDIFSSYTQIYNQYTSITQKTLKDKFKKTSTIITFTDFFTNKSESLTLIPPNGAVMEGNFNKINKYQSNTTKLLFIKWLYI